MKTKRILAALLAALLLVSFSPAALAAAPAQEEKEDPQIVERKIATEADFLRFARSCARESHFRSWPLV